MGSRSDLKSFGPRRAPIYFYIYPETDLDLAGVRSGSGSDQGLNEAGKKELARFSLRFKKKPEGIRSIMTGPELRSVQAADFIHDQLRAKLRVLSLLKDQDLGSLEGISGVGESKIEGSRIEAQAAFLVEDTPPGGESGADFAIRIHQVLEAVFQDDSPSILVCHPRVCAQIWDWFQLDKLLLKRGVLYFLDFSQWPGRPLLESVGSRD
jgi:broad specificity phosphatase PhoE